MLSLSKGLTSELENRLESILNLIVLDPHKEVLSIPVDSKNLFEDNIILEITVTNGVTVSFDVYEEFVSAPTQIFNINIEPDCSVKGRGTFEYIMKIGGLNNIIGKTPAQVKVATLTSAFVCEMAERFFDSNKDRLIESFETYLEI